MVKRSVSITVADAVLPKAQVKARQEWKYANGIVKRHPSLPIGTIDNPQYYDPKHFDADKKTGELLGRRAQESNFFITINTNKSSKVMANEIKMRNALKSTLEYLGEPHTICSFLKFGPVDPVYRNDKYADVIEKIDWSGEVEVGEQLGRVHGHVWMTCHHWSQVQINSGMLSYLARDHYNSQVPKEMQCRGRPYVHVKLLPQSDWTTVMRNYIKKAMNAMPPSSDP
jgi:hypothetical protein